MADKSKIEWTDATWNIITGCEVLSPGCMNCYAMRLAGTRLLHHPSRAGLTELGRNGPVWNGEIRFNAQWLTQPLHWRRPRTIFVCAHGDIGMDNVTDEMLGQVWGVMAMAHWHRFQVLTKRPARLARFVHQWLQQLATTDPEFDHPSGRARFSKLVDFATIPVMLPNVWIGISAEDQKHYNERWPILAETLAAVRFISYEPALGPLDMAPAMTRAPGRPIYPDWVIAGGESAQNKPARLSRPEWFRAIRDQCRTLGIPFFFKQWGEWGPWRPDRDEMMRMGKAKAGRTLDGELHDGMPGGDGIPL